MDPDKAFTADHGEAFYADGVTIMHSKGSLILDFKKTAPRFDQAEDDAQHTIVTEHTPVMLRPKMAKMLLQLLEENVENYEDQYGTIDLPDRDTADQDTGSGDSHGYIG